MTIDDSDLGDTSPSDLFRPWKNLLCRAAQEAHAVANGIWSAPYVSAARWARQLSAARRTSSSVAKVTRDRAS